MLWINMSPSSSMGSFCRRLNTSWSTLRSSARHGRRSAASDRRSRDTAHPYSSSLLRGLSKINYTNKLACDDCAIRSRCTNGRFRTVSRMENEAVLDRMQARLAERPDVLDRRRETVEHPFGTIKQWMNQGAFLMRGLEKVRAEFSLTALAYNLRRVLNIVGFAELMAAVAA